MVAVLKTNNQTEFCNDVEPKKIIFTCTDKRILLIPPRANTTHVLEIRIYVQKYRVAELTIQYRPDKSGEPVMLLPRIPQQGSSQSSEHHMSRYAIAV